MFYKCLSVVLWILCSWASTVKSQESSDVCYNMWVSEPSLDLQDRLKCNIHDQVQLICRLGSVDRDSGISVAWMYSESESKAGTGGSEVSSGVHTEIVNETAAMISPIAALNLSTTLEPGYYWCAATNVTMDSIANPSTILRFNQSCVSDFDTNCSSKVLISPSNRCAIGNYEERLMIGNLQEPDLCTELEATTKKPDEITEPPTSEPYTKTTESQIVTTPGPEVTGNVPEGLSTGLIWLIVGVTIALLLIVIAVLLTVITCLQCSRRKIKDNPASNMPHHFDNMAYQEAEVGNSFVQSLETKTPADPNSTLNGHHTYAVIPENFTLTALSGEHSPGSQTATSRPPPPATNTSFHRSLPGQYEDVDLDPIPAPVSVAAEEVATPPKRKHQYESVLNDEDEVSYNRLNRLESKSRKTSLSSVPSNGLTPVIPARGESAVPLPSPGSRESALFDNPKYSQLNKPRKHTDIYKSPSGESRSGTSHNPSPDQILDGRRSTNRTENDEYFQDSAIFLVNGLAEDETGQLATQADHYTSLQQSGASSGVETDFTHPIVSTSEKYVSEQGHLYQVLEDSNGEEAGEQNSRPLPPMYSTVVRKDKPVTSIVNTSSEVFESGNGTSPTKLGVVYNTLVHTGEHEATPTSSAYNVIERSTKPSVTSSLSSLNSDVAYNVIDRKLSNSQLPLTQYDVIERAGTSSRLSNVSPQATRIGYSVIAPNSSSPSNNSRVTPTSNRTSSALRGSLKGSSSSPSPPPSYSSLEQFGVKQRACQCESNIPFYHSLQQTGAEVGMAEGQGEAQGGREEEQGAVYSTISDQTLP